MSFDFNPDEVLQMAEQIERNGARFYREAAELVEDAEANELLSKSAVTETGFFARVAVYWSLERGA